MVFVFDPPPFKDNVIKYAPFFEVFPYSILTLASSFGVILVPHVWGSGIGLAAALHAVSTLPLAPYTCNPAYMENEPVIEFDRNKNPLRDELLLDHEFVLGKDGDLAVPLEKPGLGVTVNMEALKKFLV